MLPATHRPTWAPTPPAETGNTSADGMAAIAYVLTHSGRFPPEFDLNARQLAAALHVAPICTSRPTAGRDADGARLAVDESPIALANITRAIDAIAARHRRLAAMDRDALKHLAELFETVPADDKPNAGPMAPLQPQPKPQPPQAPAVPVYSPKATAPPVQPVPAYLRQRDTKDADQISF